MWDQHWPACVVTSGHTVRENRLGRKPAPLGVLRGGWAGPSVTLCPVKEGPGAGWVWGEVPRERFSLFCSVRTSMIKRESSNQFLFSEAEGDTV